MFLGESTFGVSLLLFFDLLDFRGVSFWMIWGTSLGMSFRNGICPFGCLWIVSVEHWVCLQGR